MCVRSAQRRALTDGGERLNDVEDIHIRHLLQDDDGEWRRLPPPLFANHDPQLGTLKILEAVKQRLWPELGPGWGRRMGLCPCIHPTSRVYARALIPRHRKCSLARKVVSNQ